MQSPEIAVRMPVSSKLLDSEIQDRCALRLGVLALTVDPSLCSLTGHGALGRRSFLPVAVYPHWG